MAWINAALNLLCRNSVSLDFSFWVDEGQDLRTPVQQTNEQTLTTSKHTFKNGDTDFLCHLINLTEVNLRGLIADGTE